MPKKKLYAKVLRPSGVRKPAIAKLIRQNAYQAYLNGHPEPLSESSLRQKYPALQDAWEQYQTVLALVRAGERDEEDIRD